MNPLLKNKGLKKSLVLKTIRILLKLDNYLYRQISRFAISFENGVHPKHRLMKYHDFFINNIGQSDSVLDVGCGNGSLTYDISLKTKVVYGIDINQSNIDFALRNFKGDNIHYIYGDATKYVFERKFDVIVLSNVLEHIENRKQFLEKLKDLTPRFIIRVPMIDRSWETLYKKELGVEYRSDNTHYIEYTFMGFCNELNDCGLHIVNYEIKFGEIWAIVN
jgi:SAM-dependent methyltransferase